VTLDQGCDRLVAALRRAVAEHGAQNSFSPRELATLYGGPPPMLAGRLGRRRCHVLSEALGREVRYHPPGAGRRFWGACFEVL